MGRAGLVSPRLAARSRAAMTPGSGRPQADGRPGRLTHRSLPRAPAGASTCRTEPAGPAAAPPPAVATWPLAPWPPVAPWPPGPRRRRRRAAMRRARPLRRRTRHACALPRRRARGPSRASAGSHRRRDTPRGLEAAGVAEKRRAVGKRGESRWRAVTREWRRAAGTGAGVRDSGRRGSAPRGGRPPAPVPTHLPRPEGAPGSAQVYA